MKATLLKDHNENKAGSVLEVTQERYNYFLSIGLIKEDKQPNETKEFKTKVKTK